MENIFQFPLYFFFTMVLGVGVGVGVLDNVFTLYVTPIFFFSHSLTSKPIYNIQYIVFFVFREFFLSLQLFVCQKNNNIFR